MWNLLSVAILAGSFLESAGKESETPQCVYVNSDKDVIAWAEATKGNKCTLEQLTKNETEEEASRIEFGYNNFAFNSLVSDRLGPSRPIDDHRHQLCKAEEYDMAGESVSIVIAYHNEALSVLIRMVNSILARSPGELLAQFVFLDDDSKDELMLEKPLRQYGERYGWPMDKMVFERTKQRQGLIRAKIHAARLATAKILVFLDSHCEVGEDWLRPLVDQLQRMPKSVAIPVVETVSPIDFAHTQAMIARAGFTWKLALEWLYFPWAYFDDPKNYVRPIKSPAMSGGLLAVRRDWFKESGEYDEGMEIWGGENIELALRMWMCGEGVWLAPCSHVAHVFRYSRPYGNGPGNIDTFTRNSLRVAAVWLDEREPYFRRQLSATQAKIPYGDVESRKALRKKLGCKDFEWYLKEVYPELKAKVNPKDEL